MTLSEAIRLGAKLRPQGKGDFFVFDHAHGRLTSCAFGAAMEAIGITPIVSRETFRISGIEDEQLSARWPWCWTESGYCPQCHRCALLDVVIVHLNDDHGWTRERIADWLETLEPQEQEHANEDERGHPTRSDVAAAGVRCGMES